MLHPSPYNCDSAIVRAHTEQQTDDAREDDNRQYLTRYSGNGLGSRNGTQRMVADDAERSTYQPIDLVHAGKAETLIAVTACRP